MKEIINIITKLLRPYFLNIFASGIRFSALKKNINKVLENNDPVRPGYRYHFLLSVWEGTRVPWYQLYLASLISKENSNVYFIYENFSYIYYPIHILFRLMFFSVCDTNSLINKKSDLSFSERKACLIAVTANVTWYTKSEFVAYHLGSKIKSILYVRQLRHYQKIKAKLTQFCANDIFIIPGGVLNPSCSYTLACASLGLKYYTYDSGINGQVIFARESVAAHLSEVQYLDLQDLTASSASLIKQSAEDLISLRMSSKDHFKYQKVARGGDEFKEYIDLTKKNILIPLSCPWDAASLIRKDIFRSELAFLEKVISIYKDYNIIIRVHPIERLPNNSRNDDLFKMYNDYENVTIISADVNINTYDLVEHVDIVLSRNTSIGAEAFISGKRSLSTTISYWNDTAGFDATSINIDLVKMRYGLAQHYNWNFPTINLSNVSFYTIDNADFEVFVEMVLSYQRHIDVKLKKIAIN